MKIAIAGYGLEGKVNYEYWNTLENELTIADERDAIDDLPDGAATILGEGAFSKLADFDLVIRTAGLSPAKIVTNGKIWSATNEFFAKCQAPIIGVTGTKGKGTTSTLTAELLRSAGKTVHLVGNIGTPALETLPAISSEDIVVYEMSSFQLWDIEMSPHIAVILMIEPDHLNVHKDFDDYVAAKGHIAAFQKTDDVVIYHPTNPDSARAASSSAGTKRRYMTKEAAYVENDELIIDGTVICRKEDVGLKGDYNLENVCAAISAAWQIEQNPSAFATAISSFKGLEHRLEYVATKRGVQYYNDSFSSAPMATLAAISAFTEPIVLIVGGSDKGIDLAPFAKHITEVEAVEKVVLIGQVKHAIAAEFEKNGFDKFVVSDATDMTSIVNEASSYAVPGGVVLLSPGCASFDMFKNFYERGRLFKEAVRKIDE